MMQPMNKRQIEISADMDEHGYKVVLTINGREFIGKYRDGYTASDTCRGIIAGIMEVYGQKFFEAYEEHADIRQAADCAWDIIKSLHKLYGRRKEGNA